MEEAGALEGPSTEGAAVPVATVLRLGLAALIAGNAFVATLAVNLSGSDPQVRRVFWWALALATAAIAGLVGGPLLRGVVEGVRRRRLAVEALFLLGIAGAVGVSAVSMARGEGPVYLEVVGVLLVIYAGGSLLKERARRGALTATAAWSPWTQRCERVKPCGAVEEVRVADVRPGDLVNVAAGAEVPVDGRVEGKGCFVVDAALTGEPHGRWCGPGDPLLAAARVVDAVTVRATRSGDDRQIDGIVRAIEDARRAASPAVASAERAAAWFAPAVLLVAGATAAFWAWVGGAAAAVLPALSVLLVACPCAFGFAAPVTAWLGLQRLARRGVLGRHAGVLAALAGVDTVVFDKTGTATVPEPEVGDVYAAAGVDPAETLALAAAVQARSSHPIARCFAGRERDGLVASEVKTLPGVGVAGSVFTSHAGRARVEVGRLDALAKPCCDAELLGRLPAAGAASPQRIAVRVDGRLACVVEVAERPRQTWPAAVAQLREAGLEVQVLSGDSGERVAALGVTDAAGGLRPEDKAARVRDLRAAGRRVLFVGDGVNDAAAMQEADAALCMSRGDAAAREVADGWLLRDDLLAVPAALRIAAASSGRLRLAIAFALSYNAVGMAVAASGWLHPVAAAVLMMASSLTVNLIAGLDGEDPEFPSERPPDRPPDCAPASRDPPRAVALAA